MTEIDRLYKDAATALDAIAKHRAHERAVNAKLTRIGAATLKPTLPTDETEWHFYRALATALPDDDSPANMFENVCSYMGINADGEPLVETETRGLSDEEFDYRHAIGWAS